MISIVAIEAAINFWRTRSPADPTSCAVCPEVNALADIYASMIFSARTEIAEDAMNDTQRAALAGATI